MLNHQKSIENIDLFILWSEITCAQRQPHTHTRTHQFSNYQVCKLCLLNTLVHSHVSKNSMVKKKIYKKSISIFERPFSCENLLTIPLHYVPNDVACDKRHVPLWFSMWKFCVIESWLFCHNDYYPPKKIPPPLGKTVPNGYEQF